MGLFEPVSAIMYLNIEDAEFEAWQEDMYDPRFEGLSSLFRHETYHAFQTWTTGYQYARTLRMWVAFAKHRFSLRDGVNRRMLFGMAWDVACSWLLWPWTRADRERRLRERLVFRRAQL